MRWKLLSIVALAMLLGSVALVTAYGFGSHGTANGFEQQNMASPYEPGMYHDSMYAIMENGTFEDLTALREEIGFQVMPWVQDADDFVLAQERHESMESWHEENDMAGHGRGRGNCPMRG